MTRTILSFQQNILVFIQRGVLALAYQPDNQLACFCILNVVLLSIYSFYSCLKLFRNLDFCQNGGRENTQCTLFLFWTQKIIKASFMMPKSGSLCLTLARHLHVCYKLAEQRISPYRVSGTSKERTIKDATLDGPFLFKHFDIVLSRHYFYV